LINRDGSTGILDLVGSDLSLGYLRITSLSKSQKRWKIEEYHKSIQSISGLEKSPTRTVGTPNNHIFSTICAWMKQEMLSFNQHLNHFGLKYKLIVNANRLAFSQLQNMKKTMALA